MGIDMKTTGNTILITGGATGIGLALAEAFLKEGNELIICGRRKEKLEEVKKKFPRIHIHVSDVGSEKEREELFRWSTSEFPSLNIFINNAGIQREIDFRKGTQDFGEAESEIGINFEGLVHLSALFIPHLMTMKEAAVVNVSSGLAFVPLAIVPVYCATKAATHSFSMSLRHQLKKTSVKIFELIPPTVDTQLDRGARAKRGQENRGIPAGEVAVAALKGMQSDEFEITVGMAQNLKMGSRTDPEKVFQSMNRDF